MHIDLDRLSPEQAYFRLTQTVIPRPVAWVLSENANGSYNLAPYSFFNAVTAAPPLLMIAVGKKPDGSFKDTRVNIEHRRHFVVHIAHMDLLEVMNASAMTLPEGESEVGELGLELSELDGSPLPRLRDARVAMACECYQIHELGEVPQSLILGRVHGMYVDDAICGTDRKDRFKIFADRLEPVGRLGAGEYVRFGEVIELGRPG